MLLSGHTFSRTKSLTHLAAISFESNLQPPTVMLSGPNIYNANGPLMGESHINFSPLNIFLPPSNLDKNFHYSLKRNQDATSHVLLFVSPSPFALYQTSWNQ